MIRATWNGALIAESDDTVIVAGNHYFPIESVDPGAVKKTSSTSSCPWKGLANYFTIIADGAENADAAWYYTDPLPAASEIKDRVAFWKGVDVQVVD